MCCWELQGSEWIGAVYAVPFRQIQHSLSSDFGCHLHEMSAGKICQCLDVYCLLCVSDKLQLGSREQCCYKL